ncbi:alpha/beta fold hydrolase [Pseudodesulfovibrio cashew]|uniref:Alpha/beta fold hydrolase n=1 Tax=Pseudodesulfovibrio cashew TaxID=2678688 RepID=A0A6I6JDS0_9BACT|nr:alpha/beta fold hydrolase [Pseudodesulfovibrio cashew]QGY38783.1 alpha/beta fold hydrolase [Pseudodesulfovibrio cashew]
MHDIRLIWCHGSLSEPWGAKSRYLAGVAETAGLEMDALDFRDLDDPDDRVERMVSHLEGSDVPAILVGSSMGGYVAAAACSRLKIAGIFLLAPAFYLPGYATHVFNGLPKAVTVVHGWRDDVVPVENAIRFASLHRAELHVLDDGHRLAASTEALGVYFFNFLDAIKGGDQA